MNKMILLTSAVILSLGIIAESRADAPAGCIGAEFLGCGWKCDSCEDGYELVSKCWFKTCAPKCPENEERINGNCTRKCSENEIRMDDYTCVKKSSHCEGGNICQNFSNLGISNCCYKTEGDTTTVYPDDKSQGYNALDAVFPDNKNLVISSGATDFNCPENENYETIYISEGVSMGNSSCHCCFWIGDRNLKFVIPDSGITGLNFQNGMVQFTCLGDIDACKQNVGAYLASNVTAATESQCNGSGSYYFTGSSCEKRPTDGTDITCEHEISGYVKVGNYCVSPENSYAKKHYTPAEAAQWLKDDNTNFVVLTFKK